MVGDTADRCNSRGRDYFRGKLSANIPFQRTTDKLFLLILTVGFVLAGVATLQNDHRNSTVTQLYAT